MMWSSRTPPAWDSHVDGAAALVKMRGETNFHVSLSCDLFRFVRRSVVSPASCLLQHLSVLKYIFFFFNRL